MTRINCISASELGHRHLIAEIRELPRITKYLVKSLKKHGNNWKALEKEIPTNWTLNKGHVKFHYNKLSYVAERYIELINEAKRRGYKVNVRGDWLLAIDTLIENKIIPTHWYGDANITEEAVRLNRERISQRNGGNLYEE